ncbi:hypothetical protein MTO96_046719 [Rhipicephalus appendiculatus]
MCISPNLSSMPLFPGHRYLGPGNPLRNGDPADEDDGIAKSHDEAYERAKSHVDVFAADQASAALFLNDVRRTVSMECQEIDGNVHITGNQIQQTQSDTCLTQAPATPKVRNCRSRCPQTPPSVKAEQELEVTVKIPQSSFSRFCAYLATTQWSQSSVTAKYSPHGPTQ